MYDQINSGFIFVAGIFYVLNLLKLIKDKDVKGISKLSIVFFSIWTILTLFFFLMVTEFWWTIGAYIIVTVLNVVYIILMIKYGRKKGVDNS